MAKIYTTKGRPHIRSGGFSKDINDNYNNDNDDDNNNNYNNKDYNNNNGNSAIFRATDSRFRMEVRMDCPDKLRKINFVIS